LVVQLKDALNTVWEVAARKKGGIWQFVRTYLVSLAGVLALGFLLLVSLLLTPALSASGKYLLPHLPEAALKIVGSIASLGVITLLFATMFKAAGHARKMARRLAWRCDHGSALRNRKAADRTLHWQATLGSTYGAAASLVVLLIWIYYSSQIVLMGAEFTHVYATRRVPKQVPDPVQPWLQWPMATGIPQEAGPRPIPGLRDLPDRQVAALRRLRTRS
jgi:membrane protein